MVSGHDIAMFCFWVALISFMVLLALAILLPVGKRP